MNCLICGAQLTFESRDSVQNFFICTNKSCGRGWCTLIEESKSINTSAPKRDNK